MKLSTPVAMTIFNRPDTTERVFRAITEARPAKLLIVADGPRPGISGDVENCIKARAITENIDWDCEVRRNYSADNLGCRKRMASGLDWVFSTVEEAIILEDDCLPSNSFFGYCQELLDYYREDTRIMQICGSNLLRRWDESGDSYFFSNYGPVWGWASWRRAWQCYDVEMKLWPEVKARKSYQDFCQSREEAEYRLNIYDRVFCGEIDTWDYQWGFAKMINHGLSVIPSVNLISNIGFTGDATHTTSDQNSPYSAMDVYDLNLPLTHPRYIVRDSVADMKYLNEFMGVKATTSGLEKILFNLLQRAQRR